MDSAVKDARKKEFDELHAKGKVTRVKVPAKGADLKEYVDGSWRMFPAGEVFDHPAPKRAAQLIALGLVVPSNEKTRAEKAKEKVEDEAAVELVSAELRDKARKIVAERKAASDKLEASLRKMTPEVLAKEVKAREIDVTGSPEDIIKAILAQAAKEFKNKG